VLLMVAVAEKLNVSNCFFSAVFLLLYADAPASVFLPPLLLFGSSPLDLGCFLLSAVRPQCTMVSLNGGPSVLLRTVQFLQGKEECCWRSNLWPCCFLLPVQRRKHGYFWGDEEEIWQSRRLGPATGAEARLVTALLLKVTVQRLKLLNLAVLSC